MSDIVGLERLKNDPRRHTTGNARLDNTARPQMMHQTPGRAGQTRLTVTPTGKRAPARRHAPRLERPHDLGPQPPETVDSRARPRGSERPVEALLPVVVGPVRTRRPGHDPVAMRATRRDLPVLEGLIGQPDHKLDGIAG